MTSTAVTSRCSGRATSSVARRKKRRSRIRDKYVYELGDWEGVGNLLDVLIPNSQSALGDGWRSMAANLIAGYGALPLVGTPEQVVEGMQSFSDAGLDGITISWVDYLGGIAQYEEVLRPLLIDAGLRVS